jgi:hypothetical protein
VVERWDEPPGPVVVVVLELVEPEVCGVGCTTTGVRSSVHEKHPLDIRHTAALRTRIEARLLKNFIQIAPSDGLMLDESA